MWLFGGGINRWQPAFGHFCKQKPFLITVMSSASPSPSPEPTHPVKQKKKSKAKGKKQSTSLNVTTTEQGQNEGTNPDWDYVPPEGTILLNHDVDSGEFDWDTVKNDEDVELWLVRVPGGVSATYFNKFSSDPDGSCTGQTEISGKCEN
jgi:hypothetical protein